MSHIQTLNWAKQRCDTTGQCTEYEYQLQHESAQIDTYTSNGVQFTINLGTVIAVIGLIVLLTPFVKPLQKFQSFVLPKLTIVTPILAGLVGGAFVGFVITFSACYKQSCSPVEGAAIFITPLATLVLTIPLARKIYRERESIASNILESKPLPWVIIGSIIILLAMGFAINGVAENKKNGERQKEYLLNSEL